MFGRFRDFPASYFGPFQCIDYASLYPSIIEIHSRIVTSDGSEPQPNKLYQRHSDNDAYFPIATTKQYVKLSDDWYLNYQPVTDSDRHRYATTIQRWFLYHRNRREKIISSLLARDGMVVFPGLMRLLRSS